LQQVQGFAASSGGFVLAPCYNLILMREGAGDNGRLLLAYLRSQRATFAISWLGIAGLSELSAVETAMLISMEIKPGCRVLLVQSSNLASAGVSTILRTI
jgi:hypothetical protein